MNTFINATIVKLINYFYTNTCNDIKYENNYRIKRNSICERAYIKICGSGIGKTVEQTIHPCKFVKQIAK